MGSSLQDIRSNRRIMAYTAAAIYGICGLDGAIEGFIPGDPPFSMLPVAVVFVLFFALLAVGRWGAAGERQIPRAALAFLGPLGVALIAYALSTSPGPGDGAVLYALPVFWTTFFFGRRGAAAILVCVAVGHAITLLALPAADSYPGRWLDVMVSICGVSLVVLVLEHRNEQLMARLAGEARTDPLTGLLNRRGFDEHASRELAHAGRDGRPIALATFDIDQFKVINDARGHAAGDRVLAQMGRMLAGQCRVIDVAARLGGDEFVVLMPDCDEAGAESFAERIRRALATPDGESGPEVRVSAGITAADVPLDVQTMLQRGDSALYDAKRAGRDRTVAYAAPGLSLAA